MLSFFITNQDEIDNIFSQTSDILSDAVRFAFVNFPQCFLILIGIIAIYTGISLILDKLKKGK